MGGHTMPRKKPAARKNVKGAGKTAAKAGKRAGSAIGKAAAGVKKRVSKIASNPRKTVNRAATNVQVAAGRARQVGDSVVTAGEVLKETAEFVDSMAEKAKRGTQQRPRSRRSR